MNFQIFSAHAKQHGFTLNNRFRVFIPLPQKVIQSVNNLEPTEDDQARALKRGVRLVNILSGGASTSKRGLEIMCSASELPGKNFETNSSRQQGFGITMATGTSKDELNLSFLLSGDGLERQIFDIWDDHIASSSEKKVGYYQDYITDIKMEMLDFSGRPTFGIKFIDSWPTLFNKITIDKQQKTDKTQFDVNFNYRTSDFIWDGGEEVRNPLQGTQPGEILEDLQNGDFEQAAYRSRQLIVAAKNGTLGTKLGSDLYGQLSEIIENTAGVSAGQVEDMVSAFKNGPVADMGNNPDRNALLELCDRLLD